MKLPNFFDILCNHLHYEENPFLHLHEKLPPDKIKMQMNNWVAQNDRIVYNRVTKIGLQVRDEITLWYYQRENKNNFFKKIKERVINEIKNYKSRTHKRKF